MPLYTVKPTGSDEPPRLIDAPSGTAALRHVTAPMFEVAVVQKMAVLAKLLSSGVKLETAGAVEPEVETPAVGAQDEAGDAKPGAKASDALIEAEAARATHNPASGKFLFERMAGKAGKASTQSSAGVSKSAAVGEGEAEAEAASPTPADPLTDPETGEVFEKREVAPSKGE